MKIWRSCDRSSRTGSGRCSGVTECYKKVRWDPEVHCHILWIGQSVWDVLVLCHLDLYLVWRSGNTSFSMIVAVDCVLEVPDEEVKRFQWVEEVRIYLVIQASLWRFLDHVEVVLLVHISVRAQNWRYTSGWRCSCSGWPTRWVIHLANVLMVDCRLRWLFLSRCLV